MIEDPSDVNSGEEYTEENEFYAFQKACALKT
jgi:hypothetical protein